jgi:hypothetical protein
MRYLIDAGQFVHDQLRTKGMAVSKELFIKEVKDLLVTQQKSPKYPWKDSASRPRPPSREVFNTYIRVHSPFKDEG